MQRQRLRRPPRRLRPAAFSLVEMLMVIGIISLLMTISVVAIGYALAGARETATDATIKKIHGLLQDRMQAFERMDFHTEITALQRATGLDKRQCEMLVRKWKFKQLFPQNRQDLQQDSTQTFVRGLPPDLQTELEQNNFVNGTSQDTDSAVLLYLALTQSSVLGAPPVDDDYFTSSEVQQNADGLNMFVDAWGNPLRFYRWPTRLIRPAGGAGSVNDPIPAIPDANKRRAELLLPRMPTEELSKDPDNPRGYQPAGLESTVIGFFNEANYHTADTYHTPLIVSAGRDGMLGLREPHDVGNYGHLARPLVDSADMDLPENDALTDNISNYRRVGGGN